MNETVLSLFLSYPIGIATTFTADKLKSLMDALQMDNLNPLKDIFVKAFFRAIDEHNNHYDAISKKFTVKIKSLVKKDKDKLFNIFLDGFNNESEILCEMKKESYRIVVAKKVLMAYNFEKGDIPEYLMKSIISDCLMFYNAAYLKNISEKEGIISLLEFNIKQQESLLEIKKAMKKFCENRSFIEKLSDYKNSIKNKYDEVNFFGLGLESHKQKKKCKLENIFVKPSFKILNGMDRKEEDIGFDDILNTLIDKNRIILGNPGSGKSTLVKYIMFLIATNRKVFSNSETINDIIPFRIELRKYLKHKKNNNCTIIGYLKDSLQSEYQLELQNYNLENLIKEYNTLVFFDGLDEIFDVEDKINIRDDINNFASNYRRTKVIVTSRIIGYDDAKFDQNKFAELEICEFDESQIKECVSKWYKQDYVNQKIPNKVKDDINELMQEIKSLEDELKRNPLLLSLVIILYQNNGQLPNSKLELYKSCTNTLVDNWDKAKTEMHILLPDCLIKRKENLFSSLALWQYYETSKKSNNINITNKNIQNHIKESIQKLQLTDDDFEAERWSKEFLNYAEKRSIYFDNTFTHKTFWEYYTALRLFKENYKNTETLIDIFRTYLPNSFWANVLELLFYMIDEVQSDNKELDYITMVLSENHTLLPLIIKFIPHLNNISIIQIKFLVTKAIELCVVEYDYEKTIGVSENSSFESGTSFLYGDLFSALKYLYNKNNFDFKNSVEEIIKTYNSEKELLYIFTLFGELELENNRLESETSMQITAMISEFCDLNDLVKKYPYTYTLLHYGKIKDVFDIEQLIFEFYKLYGPDVLYQNYRSFYIINMGRISVVDIFMNRAGESNFEDSIKSVTNLLAAGIDIDFSKGYGFIFNDPNFNLDDITGLLLKLNSLQDERIILNILRIYSSSISSILNDKRNAEMMTQFSKSYTLQNVISEHICGLLNRAVK